MTDYYNKLDWVRIDKHRRETLREIRLSTIIQSALLRSSPPPLLIFSFFLYVRFREIRPRRILTYSITLTFLLSGDNGDLTYRMSFKRVFPRLINIKISILKSMHDVSILPHRAITPLLRKALILFHRFIYNQIIARATVATTRNRIRQSK